MVSSVAKSLSLSDQTLHNWLKAKAASNHRDETWARRDYRRIRRNLTRICRLTCRPVCTGNGKGNLSVPAPSNRSNLAFEGPPRNLPTVLGRW